MSRLKVAILDDHPLFRNALRETLAARWPDAAIFEFGSFSDLNMFLADHDDVDLILSDLNTPDNIGALGVCYLRALNPAIPVIVISAADDRETIEKCKGIGISGYISKSSSCGAIRQTVEAVLSGNIGFPDPNDDDEHSGAGELALRFAMLTPRQLQVAMGLGQGKLNKQIAIEIGTSEATVKAHVSAIIHKLGVYSRTQVAIAIAEMEGGVLPTLRCRHASLTPAARSPGP
jgi:DNA-binding NarL/FixJ family response regulator